MRDWKRNFQYNCSRCGKEITDETPVTILTDFETKETHDLCDECTKAFHDFMKKPIQA